MPEDVVVVEGLSKRFGAAVPPPGVPEKLWRRALHGADEPGLDEDDEDDEDEEDEDGPSTVPPPAGWALRDVSFRLARGTGLGVVGPAGSGKSTLLRILSGLALPTAGEAVLRGRVLPMSSALSKVLRTERTGRQNVVLLARFLAVPDREAEAAIDRIARFAELEEVMDQKLRTFPGSVRSRLVPATALHLAPDVLLADERFASGDSAFRRRVLERVLELKAEGTAVVVATHDLRLVRAVADRALRLDEGRVVAEGPVEEVLAAGADPVA